jgi:hypothetical protein
MRMADDRDRPPPAPGRDLRRDHDDSRPVLWVPAYVDEDVVLALSDRAAITMHGIACYPSGFAFTLETVTRYEMEGSSEQAEGHRWPFDAWWSEHSATAHLRIRYSDGMSGALEDALSRRSRKTSAEIVIRPGGGGGGDGRWSYDVWVQPLPPPGPVTFMCEWAPMGITEARHEIEGQRFRDAAARARRIFPDPPATD